MSDDPKPAVGTIGWTDLTVPHAEPIRDFYQEVTGWHSEPLDMGEYEDWCMMPVGSTTATAGICHAIGSNADIPPQWLIYIVVADADASARKVEVLGGEVIAGPRDMGGGRFCVIRDPVGAVCALFTPPGGVATE